MSDTPRTDKAQADGLKTHTDDEEAGLAWRFARQLERELAAEKRSDFCRDCDFPLQCGNGGKCIKRERPELFQGPSSGPANGTQP